MIRLEPKLKSLTEHRVEFVIVGGVAVTAHGAAYLTRDLDFCYLRTNENKLKNLSFSKFKRQILVDDKQMISIRGFEFFR